MGKDSRLAYSRQLLKTIKIIVDSWSNFSKSMTQEDINKEYSRIRSSMSEKQYKREIRKLKLGKVGS